VLKEAGGRDPCQHGLSRRAPLLPGGVVGTPERAEAETWVSAPGSSGVAGREGWSFPASPEPDDAETWVSASGSSVAVIREVWSVVSAVLVGGSGCLPRDSLMASEEMACD
jgi:hypothetical protein